MPNRWDILDVEQLVDSAFDAFCERHEIISRQDKQKVLAAFASVAKAMKGKM